MLAQCPVLAHLDLRSVGAVYSAGAGVLARCPALARLELKDKAQRGLQECWRNAQRWRTLISAAIYISVHCSENWCLAMTSALSGERGFELRGVVKPLAFVCRHLALLALCQMFSRQAADRQQERATYCTHTSW